MTQLVVREYLRVSKDTLKTGKSPDQQHEENVKAFELQGFVLHSSDPYRDDGASASRYAKRERKGFNRLVDDLEQNRFGADVLAIWESSRGSRRAGEWNDLIDLCEKRGVQIWVTTHRRLYDPSNARDRRSLQEDAVDAEYESAKTSERIKRDVRAAAEKGRPHGKHIYGYQRVYDGTTRALVKVIPHPEHSLIVKEAARRIAAGESFYGVAKDFNERGIAPRRPTRKDHRADLGWTPPAVKQMLTMSAYAGKRQHQGEIVSDAVWPALIEYPVWQKLQAIMSPVERKRTNDWPAAHLLSGIALCGVCGAPLRVGKQNAGRKPVDAKGNALLDENGVPVKRAFYYTYVCSGVPGRLGPDGNKGFHVAMRETHLDEVATELLIARLENPSFLAKLGERGEGNDTARQKLLDEIAEYHEYLDGVRAQAAEKLRFDLLMDQESRIEPKIREAQSKLEALAEVDPLVIQLLADGALWEGWRLMGLPEKRRVMRAVIAPRVNRVGKGWKGKKGINKDRVDPGYR